MSSGLKNIKGLGIIDVVKRVVINGVKVASTGKILEPKVNSLASNKLFDAQLSLLQRNKERNALDKGRTRSKLMSAELSVFWLRFNQEDFANYRLNLLREFAEKVIKRRSNFSRLAKRKQFNQTKYSFFKKPNNKRCNVCSGGPTIRHHILQLQNGGDNRTSNIIAICNPCHEFIHPHLLERKTWSR